MEYKLFLNKEHSYFVTEASGTVDTQGLLNLFEKIIKHEDWYTGLNTLINFSEITLVTLKSDEISQISNMTKSLKKVLGDGRCAFVMNQQVDYGLARMFQMMTEPHVDFQIEIFTSLTEAETWLIKN
jgi:hypothetical protein